MNKHIVTIRQSESRFYYRCWLLFMGLVGFLPVSFAESADEPALLQPVQDIQFRELPPPWLSEAVPVVESKSGGLAAVTSRSTAIEQNKKYSKDTHSKHSEGVQQASQKPVVPVTRAVATKVTPVVTPLQSLIMNAQRGNRQAQYQLGMRYQYGDGVPKSASKAHRWLNKAAEAGNPRAQYALSLFYQQHARNPQGLKKALLWLKKAADQGLADAQYSLGMMFKNGSLVYANPAESRKWLQKAAGQGHELAQLAMQ